MTDLVPGVRLVKVRNPWGSEQYKGPWCDTCKEWDKVSKEIKDKLNFSAADDGVFYITIEDYHKGFESTEINFDVSSGWFGDHYLYLNDEDRKDATSGFCYNCTRHEFKVTNTATTKQKVYLAAHVWDDRSYSWSMDCKLYWNYVKFDIPGQEKVGASQWSGTHQEITEMDPGQVITGFVEVNWKDDQAQDWSITTWAQSGKVEISYTTKPERKSDKTVGKYEVK